MKKQPKPMCCNCKHATKGFKVGMLTHHHCTDPSEYSREKFLAGDFTAWDTCKNHKYKTK